MDRRAVNLIDDAVVVVDTPGGERVIWSLAETLGHLLTGEDPVRSYPGLAAEQASHWYRFQVRCAAKALKMISAQPDTLEGVDADHLTNELRDALVRAAGSLAAWDVWQADPSLPGFLQAPVVAGENLELAGYRPKPIGELTALIGSKEFERKSEAVRTMTALEVVYALIEYQGGVIFGGRGNYETQLTPSRSGKGSGVPFMSVRFPRQSGPTFRRDVEVMLDELETVREINGLRGDAWALWTVPWDAETPLLATELDPFFIPMARLVRLDGPDDKGCFGNFLFKASEASRVTDHTDGAMIGDPFTPFVPHPKKEGQLKVRGVMEQGFTYPEVAELLGLGQKGVPSRSVQTFLEQAGSASIDDVEVLFSGIAFEQGKTLGFFRRALPLPTDEKTVLLFSSPDPLRRVHRLMLELVRQAKKILRAASRKVIHGEFRPRSGDDSVTNQAPSILDDFAEDSDAYFRFLFAAAPREEVGDDGWQLDWASKVSDWAEQAFEAVLPRLPSPRAQRMERETHALDYLSWKLRELGAHRTDTGDAGSVPTTETKYDSI